MSTRFSLLAVLLIALAASIACTHDFDVYRMLQYDKGENQFGCRSVMLNHPAMRLDQQTLLNVATNSTSNTRIGGSFTRYVIILTLADILEIKSSSIILSLTQQQDVVGVVVLLPSDLNPSSLNSEQQESFRKLENALVQQTIEKPVYFAFENEQINAIVKQIEAGESSLDSHTFVVSEKEGSVVPNLKTLNIQGTLNGIAASTSTKRDETLPNIAIVAHYDTLGVAPELPGSLDTNGSGAVALLELARLFSKLYSSSRTRSSYNLLFLLSGGGRLNYSGTRNWLQKSDTKILDNLEFALCLESLASSHLYLHISKKTKDENAIRLFKEFKNAATKLKIPFDIVYKPLDVSRSELAWEHEAFAFKKILSATLSNKAKPTPQFTRSSILDRKIDQAVLERNIRFIGEALARFIYNVASKKVASVDVFSGSLSVNSKFVAAWLNTLSIFSRSTPFIARDTPLFSALEKTLAQSVNDIAVQESELKTDFKFYSSAKTTLSIYKVKSFLFDTLLALPIVIYLFLLHVYLQGFGATIATIKENFARTPKRK